MQKTNDVVHLDVEVAGDVGNSAKGKADEGLDGGLDAGEQELELGLDGLQLIYWLISMIPDRLWSGISRTLTQVADNLLDGGLDVGGKAENVL